MNWQRLYEIQGGLDEHIIKEKGLEGQDLLPQKILALQVELGELAQEVQDSWKFWKSGFMIDKKKVIEEFVDCLHFILSIGNELDLSGVIEIRFTNISDMPVTGAFEGIFRQITDLSREIDYGNRFNSIEHYEFIVSDFLGLGEALGFTEKEIESAYLDKNRVNHERQINGY